MPRAFICSLFLATWRARHQSGSQRDAGGGRLIRR